MRPACFSYTNNNENNSPDMWVLSLPTGRHVAFEIKNIYT